MADLSALTERQREIYDFIRDKIEDFGFPPTIRDIGSRFEIKSPNGVMCHLKALEKKGLIKRIGKAARAIQLTDHHRSSGQPVGLPYFGLVAAGTPIAAEQQDERLDLYDLFGGRDHYVLQVRGQSMIDDHIDDGDFVVIKRQTHPENGERVVASVDGEVTLKRLEKRKDAVVLHPANGTMRPIVVGEGHDIKVLGVLVGVMRKC
jgi:repressor LexA